jgi:hypothetical protein
MTEQHPISPPSELLVRDWWRQGCDIEERPDWHLAKRAAQWGADKELEACCKWLNLRGLAISTIDALHAARRPKPPSLKLEALEALERQEAGRDRGSLSDAAMADADTIRRALEALPDD